MRDWQIIFSGPADGPRNMALDEYLFVQHAAGEIPPVFRVYSWNRPWVTIGYFQSAAPLLARDIPVTRRLTGGLSVVHGNDLSYSLAVSNDYWPGVYSQEEMYRVVHQGILNALTSLGIPAVFAAPEAAAAPRKPPEASCVAVVYPHDLLLNGRKIAGSCQRRRGKTLLAQGSIHIPSLLKGRDTTDAALLNGWQTAFATTIIARELAMSENQSSIQPLVDRYAGDAWNSIR